MIHDALGHLLIIYGVTTMVNIVRVGAGCCSSQRATLPLWTFWGRLCIVGIGAEAV